MANPTVTAYVAAQSIDAQGDVSITSTSATGTSANARNGTGGFVAIGNADATSTAINTSNAYVGPGSIIYAGGDFTLAANSSTRHGDVSARAVAGGFAADVDANTTVTTLYSTTATVNSGAGITSGGELKILADSGASGFSTALADGKGFGGGGYTDSKNTLQAGLTETVIGNEAALDGNRLMISATVSSMALKAKGEGYGSGFVGVSHDYATVAVNADNNVVINPVAKLSGIADVNIVANFTDVTTNANSFAQATGLFGHVTSNAYNDTTLNATVVAGTGSMIAAGPRDIAGNLALFVNTANSAISITAEANDSKRSIAAGGSDSHANEKGDSKINWSGDVAIHAGPEPVLLIDAGGGVIKQVNVDYSINGNLINVNGISGVPGRVEFIADSITGTGGTWDFQDTLKQVRIINNSTKDLTHGDIVITETAGDLRIGTLQANTGDVALTSATGSIYDTATGGADNGSTPWVRITTNDSASVDELTRTGDDNILLLTGGSAYTGAAITGGVAVQASGAVSVVAGDNVYVPVGTLIKSAVSVLGGGDPIATDADADGTTIDIQGDLQAPHVTIEGGGGLDYLQINNAKRHQRRRRHCHARQRGQRPLLRARRRGRCQQHGHLARRRRRRPFLPEQQCQQGVVHHRHGL